MKQFLSLVLFFTFSFSQGQTILPLNNIPPAVACNGTWVETGLTLSIVPQTASDCGGGGGCSFDASTAGIIWLWPARMTVDLSTLQNITLVEIDINDNCGVNCTRAFVKNGNGLEIDTIGNLGTGAETLTLFNVGGTPLSELAVSSCEGLVSEIRIYLSPTLGLEDNGHENSFSLYPNPGRVGDDLYLKSNDVKDWRDLLAVELIASDSRLIKAWDMRTESFSDVFTIPSNLLPSGIFMVRFVYREELRVQKIVRN